MTMNHAGGQCEIVLAGPEDVAERCIRHSHTICSHCGNRICWRCSDPCYECGRNFCNPCPSVNMTCLDDHRKESGHRTDLPEKITVSSSSMRVELRHLPPKLGVASVRGIE